MPGATIRFTSQGRSESPLAHTVAQGLLLTITDRDADSAHRERAKSTAIGLLKLDESCATVDVARALGGYIEEAPALDASPRTGGNRGGAAAEEPQAKAPKARSGKPEAKPKGQSANSNFEQQHPRGRGGVWIKKGDGMGQGTQPDPRVAQLQRRLQELGYGPGAADGRYGDLTSQALAKFQAEHGLQGGGQSLDPATLQTLQSPPAQTIGQIQAQNAATAALPNALGQVPKAPGGAPGGAPNAAGVRSGAAATPTGAQAAQTAQTTLNTSDPQAVRTFQATHGLKVDGIAGPNTQALMKGLGVNQGPGGSTTTHNANGTTTLNTPAAPSRPKKSAGQAGAALSKGMGITGNASPKVKALQTQLQDIGYDPGGVDGRFGPETEKVVRRLQRKYGLKVDGIAGPQTQKLIGRLFKRAQKGSKNSMDAASSPLLAPKSMQQALAEAVQARLSAHAAGDVDGFIEARAREVALRESVAIEEFLGRGGQTVNFDPNRHPRNRLGRFRELLNSVGVGGKVKLPGGISVKRTTEGYEVHGGRVGLRSSPHPTKHSDAGSAAQAALSRVEGKEFITGGYGVKNRGVDSTLKKGETDTRDEVFPGERAYRMRHGLTHALLNDFEDAVAHRISEATTGAFVSARAREVELARVVCEGNTLSTEARKASATIVRPKPGGGKEYKFPIPDRGHAKAALAYLDSSDLSAAEKQKVRVKAKRVLAEESLIDTLDTLDVLLVEAAIGEPVCDEGFLRDFDAKDPHDRRRCWITEANNGLLMRKDERWVAIKPANLPSGFNAERLLARAVLAEGACGMPHMAMSKRGKQKCPGCGADIGKLAKAVDEAADSLVKASTPEPWSTSKTSNWIARAGGLPAYIQHISHDLHEKRGMPESKAISMAIGIVKRWCRGGGKVDATTKAAACKAVGEWNALRAKAHAA